MEARIARLESDVAHLRSDVAEIKTDVRALRDRMDTRIDRLESKLDAGSTQPSSTGSSLGAIATLAFAGRDARRNGARLRVAVGTGFDWL